MRRGGKLAERDLQRSSVVLMVANPGSGGRTALRRREWPRDASSVSWLIPRAVSRGQAIPVGLTSTGLRHHQHNRSPV